MNKTLIAAAFALTMTVGSVAIQSPASANPAARSGAQISTVAATATPRTQTQVVPQQQEPQDYPKYHDSPTATYMSPPGKALPCHFTQAQVEGKMRQVEICD